METSAGVMAQNCRPIFKLAGMKHFRGQPDHDYWRSPFTFREKAHIWLSLSFVFALIGFVCWRHPARPPFSGKFAWLKSFFYANLGPDGVVLLMSIVAGACLIAGTILWRKGDGRIAKSSEE